MPPLVPSPQALPLVTHILQKKAELRDRIVPALPKAALSFATTHTP
ncbi:MAG: hypothetical protein ACFB0G_11055 [Leptolyngbyaceae cyanobacterium]